MMTSFFLAAMLSGPADAHTPPKAGAPLHPGAGGIMHPQDATRRDRLRRMLSIRDSAPPCEEVSKQSDSRLVSDLQWLMDHIRSPPWVGVRAAQCIIALHGDQEVKRISQWVQDESKPGLALVVIGALNDISPTTAASIAQAALSGPHAARVKPRLVKSRHAEVRALLPGSP